MRFSPAVALLGVGITAALIAWGYLVFAAIDFGTTARTGESQAWWLLALASLGAAACLFLALMLIVRLLRALGAVAEPVERETTASGPPRHR